jgi:hypothetical protein
MDVKYLFPSFATYLTLQLVRLTLRNIIFELKKNSTIGNGFNHFQIIFKSHFTYGAVFHLRSSELQNFLLLSITKERRELFELKEDH